MGGACSSSIASSLAEAISNSACLAACSISARRSGSAPPSGFSPREGECLGDEGAEWTARGLRVGLGGWLGDGVEAERTLGERCRAVWGRCAFPLANLGCFAASLGDGPLVLAVCLDRNGCRSTVLHPLRAVRAGGRAAASAEDLTSSCLRVNSSSRAATLFLSSSSPCRLRSLSATRAPPTCLHTCSAKPHHLQRKATSLERG